MLDRAPAPPTKPPGSRPTPRRTAGRRRCSPTSCARCEAESETGKRLAERLSPYATGSHSSLFDRPTSVQPDSHLVCFSLRGLPERMRAPALMLDARRDLALA